MCHVRLTAARIRTNIHHEYDFPEGIGAFVSELMLTAPMPWGGIVFMMNIRRDWLFSHTRKPNSGDRRVQDNRGSLRTPALRQGRQGKGIRGSTLTFFYTLVIIIIDKEV